MQCAVGREPDPGGAGDIMAERVQLDARGRTGGVGPQWGGGGGRLAGTRSGAGV